MLGPNASGIRFRRSTQLPRVYGSDSRTECLRHTVPTIEHIPPAYGSDSHDTDLIDNFDVRNTEAHAVKSASTDEPSHTDHVVAEHATNMDRATPGDAIAFR